MRLYWPRPEPPSILPLGQRTWKPHGPRHRRGYKHLRQEGRVETIEDAVPGGDHVATATFNKGHELLVSKSGGLVEGAPVRSGVGNVAAGGLKVFEEDSNPLRHAFVLLGKVGKKGASEKLTPAGVVELAALRQETQENRFAEQGTAESLENQRPGVTIEAALFGFFQRRLLVLTGVCKLPEMVVDHPQCRGRCSLVGPKPSALGLGAEPQAGRKGIGIEQGDLLLSASTLPGGAERIRKTGDFGRRGFTVNLLRVVESFSANATMRYNLACYECQLGNLERAKDWLEKALKLGDTKAIKLAALEDPDLQPLWRDIGQI
jgi:hypothetical protein